MDQPRRSRTSYRTSWTRRPTNSPPNERIARRSSEDPGTAGDEGESHWQEILSGWLPTSFPVVTKGRILGSNGRPSRQIDLLVLHRGYPKKLLGKKRYLAAGVVAAFECKLTLRARDFAGIARTARSARELFEVRGNTLYESLHSALIYGVLAHSSEWSAAGADRETASPEWTPCSADAERRHRAA
jgi:hypothetical protein